jgi:molybdopterin synthase catalytic subunit
MIALTDQPIDTTHVLAQVHSLRAGASVLFLGTTRAETEGRQTVALDYEAYATMALATLSELELRARQQWSLIDVAIVHRLGRVPAGETSVAIAVSSAHRQAAFAAGQWLIDTIKSTVPIWKRERWSDGTEEWIHPGRQLDGPEQEL